MRSRQCARQSLFCQRHLSQRKSDVAAIYRFPPEDPPEGKKIDINGQWLAATTLLQTWMTSELDCVKVNECMGSGFPFGTSGQRHLLICLLCWQAMGPES